MSRSSLPPPPPRSTPRDGARVPVDRVFAAVAAGAAATPVVAVALVVLLLGLDVARLDSPLSALGGVWNPALGRFGLAPFAAGTVVVTALALGLAVPVALLSAVWVAELAPERARSALVALFDAATAVPSVVYGLWGATTVVPALRAGLGGGRSLGFGALAAAVVLAAMSVPTITSVACVVLRAVPLPAREAAIALGATRWEAVRHVVLPAARGGLLGAVLLGVGRTLGESIAVSMVIGGRPAWPGALDEPTSTLASLLVDEVLDATRPAHVGSLALAALLLVAIGATTQVLARGLFERVARSGGRA